MTKRLSSIITASAAGSISAIAAFGITACMQDTNAETPRGDAETAVFAGGCFWCTEADFDKLDGVLETVSGYTGGTVEDPAYREVTSGTTGHFEAVRVTYDPDRVSYETLVEEFFRDIDPTDAGGQFCDRGSSYKSAIFVANDDERETVEAEIGEIEESGVLPDPVVTEVLDAAEFYRAEDYHQDYYRKNAVKYRIYRQGCGRDARLEELWGDAAG